IAVYIRIRLALRPHYGFGQRTSAGPPLLESVVHFGRKRPLLEGESPQAVDLLVGVAGESVDRHDSLQSELSHDPEVAGEIGGTYLQRLDSTFRSAPVVFERLHGGHEHHGVRTEVARTADDVEELLHAHVRTEAALGHDVLTELERNAVRDQ